MARIYSSSYFHYTKDFSSLESILKGGFLGAYCREDFKFQKNLLSVYVPMVSFCDLPLSYISTMTYGDFAIGMNSVWGNSYNLTPVCYFPQKADNPLTRFISQLAKQFCDGKLKYKDATILAYSKPKNKYRTGGHTKDNYKERECRRVYTFGLSYESSVHGHFCPQLLLKFCENDISFIIVKDEIAKLQLINSIKSWKTVGGNPISNRELLYSKIITKQEIADNF